MRLGHGDETEDSMELVPVLERMVMLCIAC